jgi:hypothetical protein
VPLLFQNSQQCANCRIAGRVFEAGLHLRGRRAPMPVENVHDLPFAPAESGFD